MSRTLLIESEHFTKEDIQIKWSLIWYISPHQYIKVKVDNKWEMLMFGGMYMGLNMVTMQEVLTKKNEK